MTIPIGLIQAVSGTQIGLNVLTEFVIGLILPGQTVAVMTFKSLGYNTLIQALALVSDLKLGHYMHIAPISMVIAQMIGTVIGIIFNTGTAFFVIDALKNPHIFVDESWKGTYYNIFVVKLLLILECRWYLGCYRASAVLWDRFSIRFTLTWIPDWSFASFPSLGHEQTLPTSQLAFRYLSS